MSGNNMENLLLGDDSSSGDDSDTEQAASKPKPAPVAPVAAPTMQQQPPPRPVAMPPQQQPAMQRPPQIPPQQQPPPMRIPPQQQPSQARPAPTQQQQQGSSQGQPSEMTMRLKQMYSSAGATNSTGSGNNHPHSQGMQQQQPQPPAQQHRPVAVRGGVPHQAAMSVAAPPPNMRQAQAQPPQNDLYAPTPVSQIMERSKQKQQQQQQSRGRPPYSSAPSLSNASASSVATIPTSNVHATSATSLGVPAQQHNQQPPTSAAERLALDREMKKQKEKFIMFTRVLMKYLETKDPALHQKVKAIIKDCADRNKRQEPGYESVTASMKNRLQQVVGEQYWTRAEAYLNHFLKEKEKKAEVDRRNGNLVSGSGGSHQGGPGMMPHQQQQHGMRPSGAMAQQQQQPHVIPPPSSTGTSRPGPQAASMATMRQDMEQRKQALAAAGQSAAAAKQQQQALGNYPPPAKPTANALQQQQQAAAAKQGFALNKSQPAATSKSPVPTGSTAAAQSRKTSGSPANKKTATATASVAATTATTLATTIEMAPTIPREYNEFMEMVDNAVNFDWTTAGLMMGQPMAYSPPWTADTLQPPSLRVPSTSSDTLSFIIPGWAHRNVVSSRTAWARVRLPELSSRHMGNVLPGQAPTLTSASLDQALDALNCAWHNEDVAEDDAVLAAISEGCQIYLKQLLEKAIYCSRQRQNLDGIRLWYGQCTKKDPPLSLRLGCDVSRQWARTSGNAALVCKRMEEALERQDDVPHGSRVLSPDTIAREVSMSALALRPQLANGAEHADYEAKRCFEVYGGKDASEVFDRVSKRPRLELIDFQLE